MMRRACGAAPEGRLETGCGSFRRRPYSDLGQLSFLHPGWDWQRLLWREGIV